MNSLEFFRSLLEVTPDEDLFELYCRCPEHHRYLIEEELDNRGQTSWKERRH